MIHAHLKMVKMIKFRFCYFTMKKIGRMCSKMLIALFFYMMEIWIILLLFLYFSILFVFFKQVGMYYLYNQKRR